MGRQGRSPGLSEKNRDDARARIEHIGRGVIDPTLPRSV
jgi:hypothetical protein